MSKTGEVVEMDAMDVAEWEHGQHTPLASSAKLAALVKETARAPEPQPPATPPVRKTATVARAQTADSGLARATPMSIPSVKATSSLPAPKSPPKSAPPKSSALAPAPAPKSPARTVPRPPPKSVAAPAKMPSATSELTPVPEYPRAIGTATHTPLPEGLVPAHPRPPTPVPQEHVIVAAPVMPQMPPVIVEPAAAMRPMPTPPPQLLAPQAQPLPPPPEPARVEVAMYPYPVAPSPWAEPPPMQPMQQQLPMQQMPPMQQLQVQAPMPAPEYAERSRETDSLPALAQQRSRRVFAIVGGAAAAIAIVVIAIVALSGHADTPDRAPVVAAAEPAAPPSAAPTPAAAVPAPAAAAVAAPAVAETAPAIAAAPTAPSLPAAIAPTPAKRAYRATPAKKKLVLDYDHGGADQAKLATAGDDAALANARAAYAAGNQHLFSGDTDSAIRSYHQALAAYPGYVAGYRGLGLAYAQQGDKPKALDALRTYVKAVPNAKDVALIKKRIARLSTP